MNEKVVEAKEGIEMLLAVAESCVGTAPNEIEEARIDGQVRAYRQALELFE